MRQKLWALIVDVKIAERYYWHYIGISKHYDHAISALCLFTSAASISTWYIWKVLPGFWAIIAATAQIISTFQPLFPFAKRVTAATYVQQDLQRLFLDMENAWDRYENGMSDKKVRELWTQFNQRYMDIENRFAPPELFPQKMKIHDKAQREAQTYFSLTYGCCSDTEGGDSHGFD